MVTPSDYDTGTEAGTEETIYNDVESISAETSNIEQAEEDGGRSSRRSSSVWTFFKEHLVNGKRLVACKRCHVTLTYNPKTTSNMREHLKKKHPTEFYKEENRKNGNGTTEVIAPEPTQQTLEETMKETFSQENFEDALVRLFVLEDLPFSLIESKAFVDMVQLLRSKAVLFSADTLKRRVMKKYEQEKAKTVQRIGAVQSKISLTTDLWTAPNQTPFMCLTAHYVDNEWTMRTETLDFVAVRGSHSAELLLDKFVSIAHDQYNLHGKIGGITLDNASNNLKFISLYEDQYGFDPQLHFRCFGHVLNLAAQSAIDVLKDKISVLRYAIRALKLGYKKIERLHVTKAI